MIEDLHWADDATLDVIRQLAGRVRELPVVVVLTYRGEEVGLAHPLRRLLGATRGPHVAQLALAPLSEDAVAALAVGSGRDAAELFDATGGNPLFVTELIAAPPGRLPSSIKDAVVARLGQLPASDAEVVRAISIVPDRVERTAVEVLCGPSDDSLAVAEHRGLLAGDASHIWFRHELVRQAVEDTLASSERVRLHRQMARYLHDRHDDPARVVHHATHCGDIELLLTAGPAAAHQASAAGAHRQAVRHIEAVLRHAPRLPVALRADLLTLQTHSLYLLNHFDASLASAKEAVAMSGQLDDPDQLARSLIAYARTSLWAVGPESAREAIERALAVLGEDGDLELRAIAHADLARAVGELATVGSVAQANPVAVEHAQRSAAAGRAGRAARAARLRPHVPRQCPAGDRRRRGRGRPGPRHPDPPGVPADGPRGPGLRQRVRRGVSLGSVRPGGAVRRARPPAGEGHRVLLRRVPPRAHAGLRPRQPRAMARSRERAPIPSVVRW